MYRRCRPFTGSPCGGERTTKHMVDWVRKLLTSQANGTAFKWQTFICMPTRLGTWTTMAQKKTALRRILDSGRRYSTATMALNFGKVWSYAPGWSVKGSTCLRDSTQKMIRIRHEKRCLNLSEPRHRALMRLFYISPAHSRVFVPKDKCISIKWPGISILRRSLSRLAVQKIPSMSLQAPLALRRAIERPGRRYVTYVTK